MPPLKQLRTVTVTLCCAAAAWAAQAEELTVRLERDPHLLRQHHIQRELSRTEPSSYLPLMRQLATDPMADWDLRAHALSFIGVPGDAAVTRRFVTDFAAQEVAATEHGPEAFNILAEWLRRSAEPPAVVRALLIPHRGPGGECPALDALAGNPVQPYLRWLGEVGFRLRDEEIEALAATDDQLTRQYLCWLVGAEARASMAGFLVAQIGSPRSSTYRTQVDRFLVAALTIGIGEIIRQAAPTPRWLEDDATPKGLALESLDRLLPSAPLDDAAVVAPLLEAATLNAAGEDRGEWQLAIDILDFLAARRADFSGRADKAVASLARQVLRKRGPLAAFVAAQRLHSTAGIAFPELSATDAAAVWEQCFKTLNASFLSAVVGSLPDAEQDRALRSHLLGLGEHAARGSLRVVRCWGADLEGPGDWALAVAALGMTEATPTVERILDGSWNDEAARALSRMGLPGAEALARFLRTPDAARLDKEVLEDAIAACATQLPPPTWEALRAAIASDRYLAPSLATVELKLNGGDPASATTD